MIQETKAVSIGKWIAIGVLLLLLVGACGALMATPTETESKPVETVTVTPSSPAPPPPAEVDPQTEEKIARQAFLTSVKSEVPEASSYTDSSMVGEARNICSYFQNEGVNGPNILAAINAFSKNTNGDFDQEESAYFFGAATFAFCPSVYDEMMVAMDGLNA